MTTVDVAGVCPITVRTPAVGFELVLPLDVPLAELLPVLVAYHHSTQPPGAEAATDGDTDIGWVLQRLGEEPLDEERTGAALGLREGDTLYLRPHGRRFPPIHFDDVVDGVADTLQRRADTWRPAHTRILLLALTGAALATALMLLPSGGPAAPLAAIVALLLVLAAGGATRAIGDIRVGTVLGCAGVLFAGYAGARTPHGPDDVARMLAACAAAAGTAALAAAATGTTGPLFLAIALTGVLGTTGALLVEAAHLTGPQAAGVVAAFVVLLGTAAPTLAARLGGLRLPPLPADADELQDGIEPEPAPDLVRRALRADRYLTALYAASAVVAACASTVLAAAPGVSAPTLGAVLAVLLLLHARALVAAWQRVGIVAAGAYGVAVVLVEGTDDASPVLRCTAVLVLVALAAALATASRTLPGRRQLPYWGRAADLTQSIAALAVLPLTCALLGLFGRLRGIGS